MDVEVHQILWDPSIGCCGCIRHYTYLIFIWDPGFILGLIFIGWKNRAGVLGIETHIKKKELHKGRSSSRIVFHFGHHHHVILEENVL